MFNSNDYAKDKMYRADKMREAAREHLAESLVTSDSRFSLAAVRHLRRRTVMAIILVAVFITSALVLPRVTHAQDLVEAGQDEPFAPAITAYRLGHYYYITERYEEAVEQYTQAVTDIPPEVFEISLDYAMMYWDLGDAQLLAGQYEAALASYQFFLELAGDQASPRAIAFVNRLEDGIEQQVVNLTPLTS